MLHVVDVASYQWNLIKKKSPLITGADCIVTKISEGVSYRNPYAYDTIQGALSRKQGIGVYHYARAEKNSAAAEAEYFITTIRSLGLEKPVVLALDYEGEAFKNPAMDSWARAFLDSVYEETGIRPMLYVQNDMVRKFLSVKNGNYGLWVARWDVPEPDSLYPWGFYAMWQFHVQNVKTFGLDMNLFNGDRTAWDKYGGL